MTDEPMSEIDQDVLRMRREAREDFEMWVTGLSPEQLEQLRVESEEYLTSLSPEARTEHDRIVKSALERMTKDGDIQ